MKKMLLLGFCLLALSSSPVIAQTVRPGVIVVYVAVNKAVISREDGQSELLTFPAGIGNKALIAYSEAYQKLISKLYQEGYAIKSTFGSDGRYTLVFVKGQ